MKHAYQELVGNIINAVRSEALSVPRFVEKKEGCIRILIYPECHGAIKWLGLDGLFGFDDLPDFEISVPIFPGGTRKAKFDNDKGGVDVVETYSITAMKIAQLSDAEDSGVMLSGKKVLEGRTVENGFAPWKGALVCYVKCACKGCNPDSNDGCQFCSVYVSVSGGTQEEDLDCAFAAVPVIKEYFAQEGYGVILPPKDD